jgi:hypothetical protein
MVLKAPAGRDRMGWALDLSVALLSLAWVLYRLAAFFRR